MFLKKSSQTLVFVKLSVLSWMLSDFILPKIIVERDKATFLQTVRKSLEFMQQVIKLSLPAVNLFAAISLPHQFHNKPLKRREPSTN